MSFTFPKTEGGQVSSLCPPHILFPSFSSCPSFPSSRGGRGGGMQGRGFSAKNCMDTRGGWEGGRWRGGGRGGGLCRCNVAQSVCQRQAHHKISQSVCQCVRMGVAHACASMFVTVCVCVCVCTCGIGWFHPVWAGKSNHTLLKFATCAHVPAVSMDVRQERRENGACYIIFNSGMRVKLKLIFEWISEIYAKDCFYYQVIWPLCFDQSKT